MMKQGDWNNSVFIFFKMWFISAIPALKRSRQGCFLRFEAGLGYTAKLSSKKTKKKLKKFYFVIV